MPHFNIPALALDVEADILIALAVRGIELADHLLGLHARVLGQHAGNHLQGLGKPGKTWKVENTPVADLLDSRGGNTTPLPALAIWAR
jgi:hypothetical protein